MFQIVTIMDYLKPIERSTIWKKFLIGLSFLILIFGFILSVQVIFQNRLEPSRELHYSSSSNSDSESEALESSSFIGKAFDEDVQRVLEEIDCNFPNEILSMSRGVDITKIDVVPMSINDIVGGNQGIKSQLIKLSCKANITKVFGYSDQIFQLPDQLQTNSFHTVSTLGYSSKWENFTGKSAMDSKIDIGTLFGLKLPLKLGFFSASASYIRKREQMISNKFDVSDMTMVYIISTTEFRPPTSKTFPLEGNDDVQFLIESLPTSYEENPNAYLKFIEKYGTHYFSSVRFGGIVRVTTEISKKILQEMALDDVKGKLDFSYKMLLDGSLTFDGFLKKNADEFQGMSASEKFSQGGDPALAFTGRLNKWIKSVEINPKIVNGNLYPVTDLISDQSKKKSMEKAIKIYIGKAYIEDLTGSLSLSIKKSINPTGLFYQRELLKSLKAVPEMFLVNESSLQNIGKEVSLALRDENHRKVTLVILRLEPTDGASHIESGYCFHIHVTLNALNGTIEDPFMKINEIHSNKYVQISNPIWNETISFEGDFDIWIGFCLIVRKCFQGSAGTSTSHRSCSNNGTPFRIFTPENKFLGSIDEHEEKIMEIDSQLKLNLIYKLFWEGNAIRKDPFQYSTESSEIQPI